MEEGFFGNPRSWLVENSLPDLMMLLMKLLVLQLSELFIRSKYWSLYLMSWISWWNGSVSLSISTKGIKNWLNSTILFPTFLQMSDNCLNSSPFSFSVFFFRSFIGHNVCCIDFWTSFSFLTLHLHLSYLSFLYSCPFKFRFNSYILHFKLQLVFLFIVRSSVKVKYRESERNKKGKHSPRRKEEIFLPLIKKHSLFQYKIENVAHQEISFVI